MKTLTKGHLDYIHKTWSKSVEEHLKSHSYSTYQQKKVKELSTGLIHSIISNFNEKDEPEFGTRF
jgi:hypothetical protein